MDTQERLDEGKTNAGAVCEEFAAEEPIGKEQHAHHHHQVEELTEEEAVRPRPVPVHRTGHVLGQYVDPG